MTSLNFKELLITLTIRNNRRDICYPVNILLKMVFYFRTILLVSLCFEGILLSEEHKTECRAKGSCGDCIQTKDCSWCSMLKEDKLPGCFDSHDNLEICPEEYIESAKVSQRLISDKPVQRSLNSEPIQIRPQRIELNLSVGMEFTIEIEFRKAEDYPIDLYYLMDLSNTMAKNKDNLSKLGNKLAEMMKSVSSNFTMGFGSFVDKVALPYADTDPLALANPCRPNHCSSPFSFKNNMPLSTKTGIFSEEVERAQISANIDFPEGLLDALMQAMVCAKEIKWREKARHVLVVSTDATYHIAGDGKLGGIVEPHDGLCHLDRMGKYTHALIYDYPSISQISRKAVDNNMNIIFAVTKSVKAVYERLKQEIEGSSLGLLDREDNIAELVADEYQKISSRIGLTDDAQKPVYIRYSALCLDKNDWEERSDCTHVNGGSTIKFRAHIKVQHCQDKSLIDQEITIKPIGINERLTVKLHTICDCECSDPSFGKIEYNSSSCSFGGSLVCGKCECNADRIGEKCECMRNNLMEDAISPSTCIADKNTNLICSGLGECKCGVCHCRKLKNPNEKINGQFCECDNYSCPSRDGWLCSGRGECKCKRCSCSPGWSGPVCECPLSEESCKEDPQSEVCSGRGDCKCGVCECRNGEGPQYAGKYCQICLGCLPQCEMYDDCVECLSYSSGPYAKNKCENCTQKFDHKIVDHIDEFDSNGTKTTCVSADNSGCTFKYAYFFDEFDGLRIVSERNKICPQQIDIIAIALEVSGGTIIGGILLLLMWKLITMYHDKREYEKFEKERALARWGQDENPLYKTAVTQYKNPTFRHSECK